MDFSHFAATRTIRSLNDDAHLPGYRNAAIHYRSWMDMVCHTGVFARYHVDRGSSALLQNRHFSMELPGSDYRIGHRRRVVVAVG